MRENIDAMNIDLGNVRSGPIKAETKGRYGAEERGIGVREKEEK